MSTYTQVKTTSDGTGAWSWLEIAPAQLPQVAVASLPSASANPGKQYIVTDALATPITGLGLAPVGGGANLVKVWSNGTIWLIG